MRFVRLVFGVGLGLVSSCVTESGSECPAGGPGCVCYQGHLCAEGLECVSGYCFGGTASTGTNGNEGNETGGENDTGTETGGENGIGICETLITCAQKVQPAGSTTLIATYGPMGTCWELPGVEPIDCMRECRALLDGYRQLDSSALECAECGAEGDCGSPVFGDDTLCVGLNFGTGVGICIEPIDECDLATFFPYLPPRNDSCDYLPGAYKSVISNNYGICTLDYSDCHQGCPLSWYCAHGPPYGCIKTCNVKADCDCGMQCITWDSFTKLCAYPL
jgi:hypothetical protein